MTDETDIALLAHLIKPAGFDGQAKTGWTILKPQVHGATPSLGLLGSQDVTESLSVY
jgi:hypothetical protein